MIHTCIVCRDPFEGTSNRTTCSPECRADHRYRLWQGARQRARKKGVAFTILPLDIIIPDRCPILDIPLKGFEGYSSYASTTIDRLIPELGYRPDNIIIISKRANTIKSDASIEDLRKIMNYMELEVRRRMQNLPNT